MSRSWIHLLLLLLLLAAKPGYTQDFPMLHYTVDDGLPSNTVYSVYTDSKGFLWIATDKGIARYNGIKFETFTTSNGLPDNEIFFFREDPYGRLWLATYSGQLCYFKDDSFHTAANTPFLKLPNKESFIQDIHIESDSSVSFVFWHSNNLLYIKKELKKNTCIADSQITSNETILYHNKLGEDKYKIIYSSRICIADSNGHIIKEELLKDANNNRLGIHATYDQNKYYLFTDKDIYDVNFQIMKKQYGNIIAANKIYCIYKNNLGWFLTTDHGVFINDTINIISNSNVSCICQDRNRNYWLTTLGDGIYMMDENFIKSRIYKKAYADPVKYAYCDNKCMLFVTYRDTTRIYKVKNGKTQNIYTYNDNLIQDNKFSSAFLIDTNYRFYNCTSKGITIIKSLLATVLSVEKYSTTLIHQYFIRAILRQGNMLFINGRSGILSVSLSMLKLRQSFAYTELTDTADPERIFDVAKADDGQIWYVGHKNVYEIINGAVIPQPPFANVHFKAFNFFGKYIIGFTQNNQLLVYSDFNKRQVIDTIAAQNCIWENFYKVDSMHILISTNNLYRLLTLPTADNRKCSIRAIENPFVPQQAEAICSDTNSCYFFKNGSIFAIDIKSILTNAAPPQLYFNSLKTLKKNYAISGNMEIAYNQSKNITVLFSVLSLSSRNVTCQFSATSADDTDLWQEVTGDALNFYNLEYGYHTIKLRAKSLSSSYSQPVSFTLHILRPFWAMWWFVMLCVCALLSIIVAVVRSRIRYILVKNKKAHDSEVKFMKSEYKALNALMNPHFIFNTLNNVQSLVNDNNKLAANEYLRIFADLVRQNMHNVSKELIPLQKEMDLVVNYLALEKLRFEDKLTYSVNIDESVDLSEIMVPPLLIQPLVENAIKHGILPQKNRLGIITVNVHEREEKLYIEVQDNGSGINTIPDKNENLHESFGLDNIKTRIQQLSIIQGKKITLDLREIKDESDTAQGTIVTITMPV